jgi:hypothetical protein
MDSTIKTYFANLEASEKEVQYDAFQNIIAATKDVKYRKSTLLCGNRQ